MSFVWLKNLITGSSSGASSKPRSRGQRSTLPTHNSQHSTTSSHSSHIRKYMSDEMEASSSSTSSPHLQPSERSPLLASQTYQQTTTHTGHSVAIPSSSQPNSHNHSRSSTAYDPELGLSPSPSHTSLSTSSSSSKKPWYKVDARVISDATIGLSDGLTVPFALTAGLSALGNTKVVIYGGLAELIAGAISMGLGGYLGAKSELASYKTTRLQTAHLIAYEPHTVKDSLDAVFSPYALPASTLDDVTSHLASSPHLLDFLMTFHSQLPEPASNRALTSALTIASGYFFGGLLPLLPYFFVDRIYEALWISVGVMVVALFGFGYVKTCVVEGWSGRERVFKGVGGGVQMVLVGGAAAGAAMGLVYWFNALSGE